MDTWFRTLADPSEVRKRLERRSATRDNGCIEWTGRVDRYGYGVIKVDGRHLGAHRAAWLALRGDIEIGLVIDHLCRNRACINVAHLELVTSAENTRRGTAHGGGPGRKRNCGELRGCGKHQRDNGYEHTGSDGYRRWVCRTCARANMERFKRRHAG